MSSAVAFKSKPGSHGGRRMTAEDVARARSLIVDGKTQKEVAALLGFSITTMSKRFGPNNAGRNHMAVRVAPSRPQDEMNVELKLGPIQARKFKDAAAQYGKTPAELAASILSIVIADDLFKAVIG